MPRDVDPAQRLADIAAATVRVARRSGAQSVTIRAVAHELGGSTTVVTNYLPSRTALVLNALDQGRDRWEAERDAALAATPAQDRLTALADWAFTSIADDAVLRALLLELVANAPVEPDMAEALRREATRFRGALEAAAADAGFTDPAATADLVHLLVRGATIAGIEDPEHWQESHLRAVVRAALAPAPRHEAVSAD